VTRKERMWAALRGEPVDRVPFATYNLHPYRNSPHRQDESYRARYHPCRTGFIG